MFKSGDLVSFKIAPDARMVIVEILGEEQAKCRLPKDDGVRITLSLGSFDLVEGAAK